MVLVDEVCMVSFAGGVHDTLAVGSSRAIDSLAPVAKDKRDQITSFSTLAFSQLLGRCVAERSRFDRFQLSVWFGIVGNNIVPGESGRLLSCPTWVCCAVLDGLCENLGRIMMSLYHSSYLFSDIIHTNVYC